MNTKIRYINSNEFEKELKQLSKKYKSIYDDFFAFKLFLKNIIENWQNIESYNIVQINWLWKDIHYWAKLNYKNDIKCKKIALHIIETCKILIFLYIKRFLYFQYNHSSTTQSSLIKPLIISFVCSTPSVLIESTPIVKGG